MPLHGHTRGEHSADQVAQEIEKLWRAIRGLNHQTPSTATSMEGGSQTVFDRTSGDVRVIIGEQPDGSMGVVEYNGPTPPTPTPPAVAAAPAGLSAVWDGGFVSGVFPPDFDHIEVHAAEGAPSTHMVQPAIAYEHFGYSGGTVTGSNPWMDATDSTYTTQTAPQRMLGDFDADTTIDTGASIMELRLNVRLASDVGQPVEFRLVGDLADPQISHTAIYTPASGSTVNVTLTTTVDAGVNAARLIQALRGGFLTIEVRPSDSSLTGAFTTTVYEIEVEIDYYIPPPPAETLRGAINLPAGGAAYIPLPVGDYLTWFAAVSRSRVRGLISTPTGPYSPIDLLRPGTVVIWPGSTPLERTLVCDGSDVSRVTYAALFAEIGTTFGVGDGTTTFGLPPGPGPFTGADYVIRY